MPINFLHDVDITGDVTISEDLTVSGVNYGLYHATVEDGYYFDTYNGDRNLSTFLKNQRSDIIRYRQIDNYEYWNGSSWVADSNQINNIKKLLDGRQDTMWSVPSTHYKFRFTTSASTSWPIRANIGIQTSWSGSTWPGATMLVEEYDGSNWATKVTANFGGQAGGGATPLNSNDNSIDNWGLMFKADQALHTGNGSASDTTRITIDFYGWTPSNNSYVTIPLQNIFITSNYGGLENTDYTNILNYDRQITTNGSILASANNVYDIGSSSYKFKDLYLQGTVTTTNHGTSSHWNTAYGWGDHASAGYLTSYSETDTLDNVADRGATTNQSLTVGGLITTGTIKGPGTWNIFSEYTNRGRIDLLSSNANSNTVQVAFLTDGNQRLTIAKGGTVNVVGDMTVGGTVDGIDIATRDGVLTTTTSATQTNASNILTKLPLGGGTMSGAIAMGNNNITGVNNIQANGNVSLQTSTGEYALYANANGQTALYTNGIKKFETMTTGATVISSTATFLIEGDGVTSSNLKFKTNTVDRWNVNVPSGQTNLAFTTGSTNVLSLDTSNNATFAGGITSAGKIDCNNNLEVAGYATFNTATQMFSAYATFNGDTYTTAGYKLGTSGTYVGKSHNNSGRYSIETDGGRDIQLGNDTNNSILFIDTSEQRVGINDTTPSEALDVTGNIAVSGTVDGRDVAADGTKLDGIATGAEVNVQSDWNATSGDTLILNKPSIPSISGLASTSYVDTAVANVIDSAPGALDTLNELAAAINDDASFSTTITNSIALKAPLASPEFTGQVGIGTAPASGVELHVNGEVRVDSTSGIATRQIRSSYFSSSSDITVMSGSAGNVRLKNGNTDALVLDSSQNAFFHGDITIDNHNGSNPTDAGSLYFNEAGTTWGTDMYGFRINQEGSSNLLNIQSHDTSTERTILSMARDTMATTFGGSLTIPDYIYHAGDANCYFGFEYDDAFRVVAGGGEKLHITTSRARFNSHIYTGVDSTYDIGQTGTRFRNIYADTLYGDGSNITNVTATDSSKMPLAGGTFTGAITMGGDTNMNGHSIFETSENTYSIDLNDHSGYTWLRNAQYGWVFQGGTAGDDWTLHFRLGLETPGSGYNDKWCLLGQQQNNGSNGGKYKGVKILKSTGSSSVVDGDFHAGTATFTGNVAVSGTVDSRDIASDGTKLDTIDTNADVTPSWVPSSNPNYLTGSETVNAPASITTTIVNDTISVMFAASTTSNIDNYLVFSSVAGSDYGLISVIPPDDMSANMSIIDNSFDASGTQAYRIYAVKNGIYSSPRTGSISFSAGTVEATNLNVVNLNKAFYIQWDAPSSKGRFVTAYNVYKHEASTSGGLSESSATLIYSGMNTNYMYSVSGASNGNFHKFWVTTTVA